MKTFWVIWSLYVLLLASVPCLAAHHHVAERVQTTTPADLPAESEDHEVCSPFCQCATCPGFILPQPAIALFALPTAFPLSQTSSFTYHPPVIDEVMNHIWQPPRFS